MRTFYRDKRGRWMERTAKGARFSKGPKRLQIDIYLDRSGRTRSAKSGRLVRITAERAQTIKRKPRNARPSEILARIARIFERHTGIAWNYSDGESDQRASNRYGVWSALWTIWPDLNDVATWGDMIDPWDEVATDPWFSARVPGSMPTWIHCSFIREEDGSLQQITLSGAVAWDTAVEQALDGAHKEGGGMRNYAIRYEYTTIDHFQFHVVRRRRARKG